MRDNILIFANSVSCIISGYILFMKVRHG